MLRYGLALFGDIFKCWSMLSNDLERFVAVPGRENNFLNEITYLVQTKFFPKTSISKPLIPTCMSEF